MRLKKLTELITAKENIATSVGKPRIIMIPRYKDNLRFVPPEIAKKAPKTANAYIIGKKGNFEIKNSVLEVNKKTGNAGFDEKKYANFKVEDGEICYNDYPVQYYKTRK